MLPPTRPMQLRPVRLLHRHTAPLSEGSKAVVQVKDCTTPSLVQQETCRDVVRHAEDETASRVPLGGGVADNVRRWQSFGVDTSRYARVPTTHTVTDTGGDGSGARDERLPRDTAAPTLSASVTPHDLRAQLRDVAQQVATHTEAERCGQPQSSRTRVDAARAHAGRRSAAARKASHAAKRSTPDVDGGVNEVKQTADGQPSRGRGRARRGTSEDAPAQAAQSAERTPSKKTKSTSDRKRARRDVESGRTLREMFANTTDARTERPTVRKRNLLSLVDTAAVAEGAVAYEELDDSTALFDDLARALHDPNRIQAPPLFVGLLLSPPHTHTNFTLSASTSGKAHFVAGVDPRRAHMVVGQVVTRWRDRVYVMRAQPTGLELLLRVLRELPGVELITFHAPAVLLPLLSYADDAGLVTHCVSDVRVMGWMAHVTEADGTEAAIADCTVLQRLCAPTSGVQSDPNHATLQGLVNQVYALAPLYSALYGQLGAKGLLQAFIRQEKRIALLLARMKRDGFVVDLAEVEQFKKACTAHMNAIRDEASALVPQLPDFNIQSHEHCRHAIYELLDLGRHLLDDNGTTATNVSITKGGKLSTAEDTLRLLAPRHPFPRLLLRYRKIAKLAQTYLEGTMSLATPCEPVTESENDLFTDDAASRTTKRATSLPTTGFARLHANFLQEGTDTGRLSCVEPNLQNIPRCAITLGNLSTAVRDGAAAGGVEESAAGREDDDDDNSKSADERRGGGAVMDVRRCFVAPDGFCLLSVDYQQIELRVLAHLSEDAALVSAMTQATDIHRRIAEMVFKKVPVSAEERNLSKRVVFGVIYGAGPRTLASQMNLRVEDALRIATLLKTAFPRIASYHQQVIDQGRQGGFVRTMSGRVRYLPDINSPVMVKRAYAERQAFNTVVQGSAADVMKMGMLAIERDVLQCYGPAVQLLTQIHDEVILAVHKDKLREVVPKVMHAMSHAVSLLVPLCVTAKVGPSLAQLEEWSVDHDLGIRDVS